MIRSDQSFKYVNQNFCRLQSALCKLQPPLQDYNPLYKPLYKLSINSLLLKPVHLGRNSTGNVYINSSVTFQLVTCNSQVRAQLTGGEPQIADHEGKWAHANFWHPPRTQMPVTLRALAGPPPGFFPSPWHRTVRGIGGPQCETLQVSPLAPKQPMKSARPLTPLSKPHHKGQNVTRLLFLRSPTFYLLFTLRPCYNIVKCRISYPVALPHPAFHKTFALRCKSPFSSTCPCRSTESVYKYSGIGPLYKQA
jgi:hypothetical protein